MQVFGFTLNLLTLLAIVLVGRASSSTTPSSSSRTSSATSARARRRSQAALVGARELVGPDHRHDHHAGRGLRAHRLAGRPHRRAVPRVRLHARRRGLHLRRRRADAVADDVVAPAQRRARATGSRARRSTAASTRSSARYERMLGATLRGAARRSTSVWIALTLLARADVPVLADGAGAQRGPGRRLRRHRRAAQRDARAAHAVHRRRSSEHLRVDARVRSQLPDHVPDGGFGGMLVKPWDERKRNIFRIQEELAPKLARITGIRAPAFLPPALPSAGHLPGRVRHRVDGEPRGARPLRAAARRRRRSRAGSSPSRRSPTCASIRRRRRSSSTATRSRRWG